MREGAERRAEALHRFVRDRRLRLAPDSLFLAKQPRLPNRVGKPVTQEELAEHLGITRGWYSRFEAGAPAVFSIALLDRLGDMLTLSAPERAELVNLAMPQLAPMIARDSTDAYEMVGVMRRAVKRLFTATSEDEILHVAGEEVRRLLPCFELVFARRVGALEEVLFPQPGRNSAVRLAGARTSVLRQLTPKQVPCNALCHDTPPGVLLSLEVYPPDILRLYRLSLHEYGIDWDSPLAAHVRGSSSSALVGGTSTRSGEVTRLERTMLSTIADFASLALQGASA